MAARKPKEILPAKKRKEAPIKATPPIIKSKEIVSDSDDSEEDPAPQPSKKNPLSQGKTEDTKSAGAAVPTGNNSKGAPGSAEAPSASSEAETGSEEEEEHGGSTEQEGETTDDSGSENAASSSASSSPTQDQSGTPANTAAAPLLAQKTSYAVAPVNGVKRKAETQLERGTNEDETDEELEGEVDDRKEEEGESESSEEDEDEEDESGSAGPGIEQLSIEAAAGNSTAEAPRARAILKTYEPPAGFSASKISFASSSEVSRLLQASSLERKQIWHITAPAKLPLSSLTDIASESLRDGSSILSHNNADYGLVQDPRHQDAVLLLPSGAKNRYSHSQTLVSAIYHVGQIVKLPVHEPAPAAAGASSKEQTVARHQQPEGLKMRFRPFGVDSNSDSDSDSDEVPRKSRPAVPPVPTPVFRQPPSLEKPSAHKKKKKRVDDASELRSDLSSSAGAQEPSTSQSSTQINGSDMMDIDSPKAKSNPSEKPAPPKNRKSLKDGATSHRAASSSSVKPEESNAAPVSASESKEPDEMNVDKPETKQRKSDKPDKPKKSRKSEINSDQTPHINGADTIKASLPIAKSPANPSPQVNGSDVGHQRSKESKLETPAKPKRGRPPKVQQPTSEVAASLPQAASDATETNSLPKSESQPSDSTPAKVATESLGVKSKTPEKPHKRKSLKSTLSFNSLSEPSISTPAIDPNAMDIDHSTPTINNSQPRDEPLKAQDPIPTTSASKETPEERIKRKEERRRQKALRKQEQQQGTASASSQLSNGNLHSSPSKILSPDPPALPLAEYSALLGSAEKAKSLKSSQSVPPKTAMASQNWSQSTTGEQSSPSGKKKKNVRWTDGGGG